jgi:RNA polymerase sigma-70 factor (ECF subfamily)
MAPKSRFEPVLRLVPEPVTDPVGSVAVGLRSPPDGVAHRRALPVRRPSSGAALLDRARPIVDKTLRRLLGNRDVDYDDLAQQAMIEIVSTIGRYRGDCSLDSWARLLTARVVFKHLRRRKTERRIFGSLDADLPARDQLRTAEGTLRHALVRNVMQRILGHLDSIDQDKAWTFVLHDVCGYDLREIATITGASMTAAQTRLVRGRHEVHERIAADPELANLLESFGAES